MVKRLLAAILGGIVMFLWGGVAHMLLPLGEMGVSYASDEDRVLSSLEGSLDEPGMYMLPGLPSDADAEAQKAHKEKMEAGPYALVVFHPDGHGAMSMEQFATQLGSSIVAALLAVFLLSSSTAGFLGRVLFTTLLGVIAWASTSVPHWNWFGFPKDYMLAEGIYQTVGWFLTGLVLAKMVKPDR